MSKKIYNIIHSASTAAAVSSVSYSESFGFNNFVIVRIQTIMIMAIGSEHGVKITKSTALNVLSQASANMTRRHNIPQVLFGWMPGFGNAISSSTIFAITEAIGWGADTIFENQKEHEESAKRNLQNKT